MPGTLQILKFDSEVLKKNPLGDPSVRDVHVYLPPKYTNTPKVYPALLGLNGFTGNGQMFFNGTPFQEGLKERMDRLIKSGKCPPCIVVAVDCFTRVGGSQFLNSSATGQYEDYLMTEIIPMVNEKFSPTKWGVFGKSSGGFGSMVLGMRHPQVFQAIANHSGDCNFELCYLDGFHKALTKFKKAGGPKKWLDKFWDANEPQNRKDVPTLDKLGMSACYSPNPHSDHMGIDFPFNLETGLFQKEVWERWRTWDPINLCEMYRENLRDLKLIYIDCGTRDEFSLHWGNKTLADKIKGFGANVHWEEFDDGHMQVGYRLDHSLPLLAKALS